MKKFVYCFLMMLFLTNAYAATIFTNQGLYGLKDDDGKVVIKPLYQNITQLQYTPVKTVLIPMQSTKENEPVKTNYFKVKDNGLYGVVDNEGKTICNLKYDDIKINEYGEIITVKNGEETLLNPVKNKVKKTTKTVESIVGLPVTIVAGALMPIQVISKIGKK